MNKYERGKIYKIECLHCREIYIGSTTEPTLARRLHGHRGDARRKGTTILQQHINENGKDLLKIILIENYPCKSKDELRSREDYWIKELKPKFNTNNAVFSREKHLLTKKKYNNLHIEGNKEYHKIYCQTEKYKESQRRKYMDNKEHYKEMSRVRRQQIKIFRLLMNELPIGLINLN
jgi:hypothetical protein